MILSTKFVCAHLWNDSTCTDVVGSSMPTPRAKREGKVMPAICELQGLRVGGGGEGGNAKENEKALTKSKEHNRNRWLVHKKFRWEHWMSFK